MVYDKRQRTLLGLQSALYLVVSTTQQLFGLTSIVCDDMLGRRFRLESRLAGPGRDWVAIRTWMHSSKGT